MVQHRTLASLLVVAGGAIALSATMPTVEPATGQDPAMEAPSEHHQRILESVGEWEGTLTWAEAPGMPAGTTKATESVEKIGGFWTRAKFECDFMGMPYHGSGLLGYSAKDKKYVGTWVDSMSSHFSLMEGQYDEKRKLLVMHWEAPDMTGKMNHHRSELTRTANEYSLTFFVGKGDAATQMMVIAMKRKAKGKKGGK